MLHGCKYTCLLECIGRGKKFSGEKKGKNTEAEEWHR